MKITLSLELWVTYAASIEKKKVKEKSVMNREHKDDISRLRDSHSWCDFNLQMNGYFRGGGFPLGYIHQGETNTIYPGYWWILPSAAVRISTGLNRCLYDYYFFFFYPSCWPFLKHIYASPTWVCIFRTTIRRVSVMRSESGNWPTLTFDPTCPESLAVYNVIETRLTNLGGGQSSDQ